MAREKKEFHCDYCGTGSDTDHGHAMDCADPGKCFACDKKLKGEKFMVDTRDDQRVYVGPECYRHVKKAGESGYQPRRGGPRLWLLVDDRAGGIKG